MEMNIFLQTVNTHGVLVISKAAALWSWSSKDTLLVKAVMNANLDEGIESMWVESESLIKEDTGKLRL